jgi:hypothetical protein
MTEELAKVNFSDEQVNVIHGIRKTVNGMLLLQGGGGSGKSKVLATMATFLARAGFHVLATAPAHTTTNRILQTIEALQDDNTPDIERPVRAFRIGHEKLNLLDQEDLEADLLAEWMGSDADLEIESLNIAHELETMQLWIADPKKRAFALPYKSISQLVLTNAINKDTKHMASYPTPPHARKRKFKGAPQVEYEAQIDFYEEFRRFLSLSETSHVKDWDQDDKRKIRHVRKILMQAVTADKRIMVTTTGNVNSDVLKGWADGGKLAMNGIAVLIDEAQWMKEVSTWGLLFKSNWREHIVTTVFAGDKTQLTPQSRARAAEIAEFGPQNEVSWFNRLINGGAKTYQLTMQHRMHPVLSDFPNRRVYGSSTRDARETTKRIVSHPLSTFLLEWLGIEVPAELLLIADNDDEDGGVVVPALGEEEIRSDIDADSTAEDVGDDNPSKKEEISSDIDANSNAEDVGDDDPPKKDDGSKQGDDDASKQGDGDASKQGDGDASKQGDDDASKQGEDDGAKQGEDDGAKQGEDDGAKQGDDDVPINTYPRAVQDLTRLRFIHVEDSYSEKDKNKSRSNRNHIRVVWDLIEQLFTRHLYDMKEILILTPYSFLKKMHSRARLNLAKKLNCTVSALPEIGVVDGWVGCDKGWVLLDVVIHSGNGDKELGFMVNEGRAHVACTRAKDHFFIFGNRKIAENAYFEDWEETKRNFRNIEVPNLKPYMVAYITELLRDKWTLKSGNAGLDVADDWGDQGADQGDAWAQGTLKSLRYRTRQLFLLPHCSSPTIL